MQNSLSVLSLGLSFRRKKTLLTSYMQPIRTRLNLHLAINYIPPPVYSYLFWPKCIYLFMHTDLFMGVGVRKWASKREAIYLLGCVVSKHAIFREIGVYYSDVSGHIFNRVCYGVNIFHYMEWISSVIHLLWC